jgi:hypothetical protein
MATNLIIAIALFAVSALFVGTTEGFWLAMLYFGVAMVVMGVMMMSSQPFRERFYHRYMNDPGGDKLLSSKQRTFFDHYYYPLRAILAGLLMVALYCISHAQLIDSIIKHLI